MNRTSFMSANYVARQLDYKMTEGWMQGDSATQAWFQPIATFAQRFDAMLLEIASLGFRSVDIWLAHLHWSWATPAHVTAAHALLQKHNLTVNSLAGNFGTTPAEVAKSCQMANQLGTTVLGGNTPLLQSDRAQLIAVLKEHGVRLGVENHPEKTPTELLAKIGDGADGHIGAAVDTGWFGTQGYNAAKAIDELSTHLLHIHLKDVLAVGGHETCRFGQGIVPVQECVVALQQLGYQGPICVEHEPNHGNPNEDCRASLQMLTGWLGNDEGE